MQKQTGRKALIVLSDGVDTGSEATVTDAIEAAQKADTLIYSILFSDEGYYGVFGGGGGRPRRADAHVPGDRRRFLRGIQKTRAWTIFSRNFRKSYAANIISDTFRISR